MPGNDLHELTECYRGTVARWELDENDHWNARFYLRDFQQASEQIALRATGRSPGSATASVRHIRYFSELRGGEAFHIVSGKVGGRYDGRRLLHLMKRTATGALCAAALDECSFDIPEDLPAVPDDMVEKVGPRGLEGGGHEWLQLPSFVDDGKAFVTGHSVVRPAELDHCGNLLPHELHRRVGAAVSHLWLNVGAPVREMEERGLGRALVEAKTTRFAPIGAGDPVRIVSWFEGIDEKAFRMRHQIEHGVSGTPMAAVSALALVLDRTTRKAVPVPEQVRAAFQAIYR